MDPVLRTIGYVFGVAYWLYQNVPRFDTERRRSPRYQQALGVTKNIWIGSGCLMLILIQLYPLIALPLTLAISLLTAFVCYTILDEIE